MQRWQERLAAHPIHTTLATLERQASVELELTNPAHALERARFKKVLEIIRQVIKDLDPDLAPFNILDQLNDSFQAHYVLNTMSAYEQQPDPNHLRTANDLIVGILSYVYQLAALKRPRQLGKLDVEALTSGYQELAAHMRSENDALVKKSADATQAFGSLYGQIKQLRELADKLSAEVEGKKNEWDNQLNELQATHQANFERQEKELEAAHSNLLSELKSKVEVEALQIAENGKKEINSKLQSLDTSVEERLTKAQEILDKIVELYGLVGKATVTGEHKTIAEQELDAAWWWRSGALGVLGLALAWVFVTLIWLPPSLDPARLYWTQIAKGVSLTAILLSISLYAARQAAQHRASGLRARSFALKIGAFDPFIQDLDSEMRQALKAELSRKIFGSDALQGEPLSSRDEDRSPMGELADQTLKLAKAYKSG